MDVITAAVGVTHRDPPRSGRIDPHQLQLERRSHQPLRAACLDAFGQGQCDMQEAGAIRETIEPVAPIMAAKAGNRAADQLRAIAQVIIFDELRVSVYDCMGAHHMLFPRNRAMISSSCREMRPMLRAGACSS